MSTRRAPTSANGYRTRAPRATRAGGSAGGEIAPCTPRGASLRARRRRRSPHLRAAAARGGVAPRGAATMGRAMGRNFNGRIYDIVTDDESSHQAARTPVAEKG